VVQPAFSVAPVDTTGAGDTFCGVLVAALDLGAVLQDAMRQASAASALACTVAGAQSSVPTPDAVAALLQQQPTDAAAAQALREFCGLAI
jgi:ribokinase